MYNDIFKKALDICNEHGSYNDFLAAVPIKRGTSYVPIGTLTLIWEMAEYTCKIWLKE